MKEQTEEIRMEILGKIGRAKYRYFGEDYQKDVRRCLDSLVEVPLSDEEFEEILGFAQHASSAPLLSSEMAESLDKAIWLTNFGKKWAKRKF